MSKDASIVRSGESLVLGNGQQLALIDVDADEIPAAAYKLAEQEGRWTGQRLFLSNPRLYGAITRLLARALPYREIAEICQVSVNTVCGVAWREGIPIETLRERIARAGMTLAQLTVEAAIELLADEDRRAKLSGKDLMVMHGIAFSNAQLASGGATARIEEHDITPPGHADYLAFIQDVTPKSTGLRGGNRPTNGATVIEAEATEAGPAASMPDGSEQSEEGRK